MKAIKAVFAIILFLSVFAGGAYAGLTSDQIFMTSGDGTIDHKTYFGWDEEPWLFIANPYEQFHFNAIMLKIADSTDFYSGVVNSADHPSNWYQFPNWNGIKTEGKWDVYATLIYPFVLPGQGDNFIQGYTTFTVNGNTPVTPEPISTSLFLLGGAALSIRQIRRKKNLA